MNLNIRDISNLIPDEPKEEYIPNDITKDFYNDFMNMPYDKRLFKNNISSVKYQEKSDEEMGAYNAEYVIEYNIINYKKSEFSNSICHELLHASSTLVKDDLICSGFMQKNKGSLIGVGINEAFTAYFDDKYFTKYRKDKEVLDSSYLISKRLISFFDTFIPVEEMAEYYFKADLFGLIMRLSRYVDPRRVVRMIIAFDGIYKFEDRINKNYIYLMKYYDYVINFIVEYNLNVLNGAYFNGDITDEVYSKLLSQIKDLTETKVHPIKFPFFKTPKMSDKRFNHFNDNSKRYILSRMK